MSNKVTKKESKTYNLDNKLSDQKLIQIDQEYNEKAKVQDKQSFEDFKKTYEGKITEKCISDYGSADDKKLWEDTAKELYLEVQEYMPEVDEKTKTELNDKLSESKHLREDSITTSELVELYNAIEDATDIEEIQVIIYNIVDEPLEEELQFILDGCEEDGDDLDTTKSLIMTAIEEEPKYRVDENVKWHGKTFKDKKDEEYTGYDHYGPKTMNEFEGPAFIQYDGGPGNIENLVKAKNGKFVWRNCANANSEPYKFNSFQDASKVQEEMGGEILSWEDHYGPVTEAKLGNNTFTDRDEAEYYKNKELYANSGLERHRVAMDKAQQACKEKGIEVDETQGVYESKITESKDTENLDNIKNTLKDCGIKTERTLDLMSKDILKELDTTCDEDCKQDGIYLQPVIVNAIQDKIEKITGKRPELKFGESKEVKTESKSYTAEDNFKANYEHLEEATVLEKNEDYLLVGDREEKDPNSIHLKVIPSSYDKIVVYIEQNYKGKVNQAQINWSAVNNITIEGVKEFMKHLQLAIDFCEAIDGKDFSADVK